MEFWGVEVKSGQPLKVSPGDDMMLHLSQANIGELKKQNGNESVNLFVTIDGKKLVIGTLFTDKLPQQQFDLVFEKDFELSHNWKSGSVFFYGYKASNDEEDDSSSGESDEDIQLNAANNGKQEMKAKEQKSAEVAAKPKVLTSEPGSSSDEDTDEEDGDDSEDLSSDSPDNTSDESEEETPKKAETSKKRPAEAANKTPVPEKKAKAPQSADGKKGSVHVDTPHPAKKAGKTPANKPNQQSPKSGGSHSCNTCNKTFVSEKGRESHSKAKHGK